MSRRRLLSVPVSLALHALLLFPIIAIGLYLIWSMKLWILPRALDCRLTEIIACSVRPMAAGSISV